jgi:hypothetical protein
MTGVLSPAFTGCLVRLVDGYAKEAAALAIELGKRPTSISIIKHMIKKSTKRKWQ